MKQENGRNFSRKIDWTRRKYLSNGETSPAISIRPIKLVRRGISTTERIETKQIAVVAGQGEPMRDVGFKITGRMHPNTYAIAVYCLDLVGSTSTTTVAKLFDVAPYTVYKIAKRLNILDKFAKATRAQKRDKIDVYLSDLAEGTNVEAVAKIFGVSPDTVFRRTRKAILARLDKAESDFAEGIIDKLPTYNEIASELGCPESRVITIIRFNNERQSRLREARAKAKEEEAPKFTFRETPATAWFLGALFGGGCLEKVDGRAARVILTNEDDDVLQVFKSVGESIIPKEGIKKNLDPRYETESIIFYHSGYAQVLAPFSVESKASQIVEDYAWVRKPEFLPSFIGGLIDGGGVVHFQPDSGNNTRQRRISFTADKNEALARFYLTTLKLLGIQRPRIERENGKTKRVYFGNIVDLKTFAEKIHLESGEKQAVLNRIKAYGATDDPQ